FNSSMGKALMISSNSPGLSQNQTRFFPIGTGIAESSSISTESNNQIPFYADGIWSKMAIRVTQNPYNPTTVVSRINGADGNQAISAVGTGIFEDVSNTDSVSSGDLLNISITTPSGSGSFFFSRIRSIFEVESET